MISWSIGKGSWILVENDKAPSEDQKISQLLTYKCKPSLEPFFYMISSAFAISGGIPKEFWHLNTRHLKADRIIF